MHTLIARLCVVAVALGAVLPATARAAGEQDIVDRARAVVEQFRNDPDLPNIEQVLGRAKGVMIFPSVLKAGFVLGGEGGSGVLLARTASGEWSYPAFYTLVSASVGLQLGAQEAQVLLAIMTDNGLRQMLQTQFKLGAGASIAVGPKGMGLEAATTAALGADIYTYARTRGAYGGGTFEGSYMISREEWNREYYGQPVTAQEIVLEQKVANAAADPLRHALAAR